jgi:membrane protease YdiL (CAAX protease family)
VISFKKAFLYVLIIGIYYNLSSIPEFIANVEILYFIYEHLYFLIFPVIAIFLFKGDFKEFKKLFVLEQKNKLAHITLVSFSGYVFFFISFLMFFYAISVAVDFTIPFSEKKTYTFLDIIYFVIISSVFEELFFRRILSHQFFMRYGLKKAVFYSAFLFTMIHSDALLHVFIAGTLLGIIYLKTKNIYIVIGLHSLTNLHQCFLVGNTSVYPIVLFFEDYKCLNYFWIYYTLGFVFSILALYYSFRYINKYHAKYISQ